MFDAGRCLGLAPGVDRAHTGPPGNSHAQGPLPSVHLRVAMSEPTSPSGMHTADEEHVPVLDDSLRSGARAVSEEVIPLVEETAIVGKREVITGRVRVQTVTDAIEELARADVQRETVDVTRVPIDRIVETAPEIRTEGDVTIVPVRRRGARGREAPCGQGGTAHPAPRRHQRPSRCRSPCASSAPSWSVRLRMIRP